jgi:hypothetical protein
MRALRTTVVTVAVLGGLFVAADRLAVHLAEEEAAQRITEARELAATRSAEVTIHGFPFLTQLVDGELDEVDVRLDGMTARAGSRPVTVTRAEVRLTGVRAGTDFSSFSAGRAAGTATVSYADLNKIAPEGVHVAYAGEDRAARDEVRLTATVSVLGREVELPRPVYSTVQLAAGDEVRLRAASVPGGSIPGAEGLIRERIDFGAPVRGLPAGLSLGHPTVTGEGVTFTLRGEDVDLGA